MRILKSLNNKKGETIVEVLIAITVLAAVLGGVLAISNKSRLTMQANQERYQAQQYANSQADMLKLFMIETNAQNTMANIVEDGKAFCLTSSENVVSFSPETINESCIKEDLYNIYVYPHNDEDGVHTFVIQVLWDSLVNKSQDKVELVYGT